MKYSIAVFAFVFPALCFAADGWFGIRVVDAVTGAGVPLADLRTVNEISHISDNAGWIAFREPGLMEQEVFFHVASPGYEVPKDGFGYRGVRLIPKAGDSATIKLRRTNLATRVGRMTGSGRFRDSELLGKNVPSANHSLVLGQDSVQCVRYNGGIFLLWGDTSVAKYPLGNFMTTSAVLPVDAHPSRGLEYGYFRSAENPGELRRMLPLSSPGAVWMFGLHVLRGEDGRDVLLSGFGQHRSLGERTRQGIAKFDDAKGTFTVATEISKDEAWRVPRGVAVEHEGYVYFASPFLHTRVAATVSDFTDPASYEALWFDPAKKAWKWQREYPPTLQKEKLPEEHARFALKTPGGAEVNIHTASIRWNEWRNRWVLVGIQSGGKNDPSAFGEVWYSESTSLEGPWVKAVKIATHPGYTFYNPVHHAIFDSEGGRMIWFEGTYTKEFSGNPTPTPRYDYNQLMYKLDLKDVAGEF
jgi:hypothetical protein